MVSIGIAKEVTKQDRDWHTTPPIVLWQRMDCNRNFDALQPFQNNHRTRPPRQLIITPSFHPHTEPAATSSLVEAIPIGPVGNPQIPSQIGGLSPRHAAIFLESAPCIRSGSGENGQSCNQIDLEIEGITVYCPHLGALQTAVNFPNQGAAEIGEGDAVIQRWSHVSLLSTQISRLGASMVWFWGIISSSFRCVPRQSYPKSLNSFVSRN
jgi:hypothetical protein